MAIIDVAHKFKIIIKWYKLYKSKIIIISGKDLTTQIDNYKGLVIACVVH